MRQPLPHGQQRGPQVAHPGLEGLVAHEAQQPEALGAKGLRQQLLQRLANRDRSRVHIDCIDVYKNDVNRVYIVSIL